MTCKEAQAKFQERLDGRLTDVTGFDAHLAGCAACRQAWAEELALWDALGRVPALTPSFGFAERTLRRLHETPQRTWVWPVWRWATVAGALMVLGVAGVWVQHQWTGQQAARVYASAQTDQLEDFDVIAVLHELNGEP